MPLTQLQNRGTRYGTHRRSITTPAEFLRQNFGPLLHVITGIFQSRGDLRLQLFHLGSGKFVNRCLSIALLNVLQRSDSNLFVARGQGVLPGRGGAQEAGGASRPRCCSYRCQLELLGNLSRTDGAISDDELQYALARTQSVSKLLGIWV